MKAYMKPTISLAVTNSGSGFLGSCIVKADMDLIESIIGGPFPSDAFGIAEACVNPIPIDIYCKFTSAELGAAQAFIS